MAIDDRLHQVVDPVIADLGLELVDLVYGGGRLKITVDHPDGLGSDLLARATRLVGHELDLADPISGSYTLEVTSPGVERPLRTPAHYRRAIGEQVALKLRPNPENLRRVKGELVAADDQTCTIAVSGDADEDSECRVEYDQIAKAKTVFDWDSLTSKAGAKVPNRNTEPKG